MTVSGTRLLFVSGERIDFNETFVLFEFVVCRVMVIMRDVSK